ncbi:hypothetical protein Tcan_13461 [Toxocara canis]|uniref:Uncharacterized protein n=1 Tax=Toxocara canis TaxID=6265 RepID=A0A0B2VPN0_TOXCA|nr:hypothetical protein Tcan_13461 [Toxocara canis]
MGESHDRSTECAYLHSNKRLGGGYGTTSLAATSYLASLQQTNKALRDGRIEDMLARKADKSQPNQGGNHPANDTFSSHKNAPITDSAHTTASGRHRDSSTSISSVISELWQQKCRRAKDTLLKEIKIRDADELSEPSSISEIPLSQTSPKKREYGNTSELQTIASESELYEPGTASTITEKDHRETTDRSKANEMRKEFAATRASFGSSERQTSTGTVSTGTVHSNVSGSRLKEIRKSIDLSLNSPSYAYDFDSDTSLDTLMSMNLKATPKTRRASVSLRETTTTRPRLANKQQSPFKTTKAVRSGSSTDVDSKLDEMESIPEEVLSDNDADSYGGQTSNSVKSGIIATFRESDNFSESKRNDSTPPSSKMTTRSRYDKVVKMSKSSAEKKGKETPSRSESTSSTKKEQLSEESSRSKFSTSKNSDSASNSSSSETSDEQTSQRGQSLSDSEESKAQSSATGNASAGSRSGRVSKTSIESLKNERKSRKGKKRLSVSMDRQSYSPANQSEDAVSKRSICRRSTSDSVWNRRKQASKTRQEKNESEQYSDDNSNEGRSLTDFQHHSRTPIVQAVNRTGEIYHMTHKFGIPEQSGEKARSRSASHLDRKISQGTSKYITSYEAASRENLGIKTSRVRLASHEDSDAAAGLKTDTKTDWKTETQLVISTEELRQLVKIVVDEVIDGQNNKSTSKKNCSVQTDFYEQHSYTPLLDAHSFQYFQDDVSVLACNRHVSANVLRSHIELLKREADRERRALREWDCIMHDFEQRCHVIGLDRLKRILNSRHLHDCL